MTPQTIDPANLTPAAAAAAAWPKAFTLPSGINAEQIRPLKGRDAVAAHRIAGKESEISMSAAMMAQVVTLNGKGVVMEDLLDLDLEDLTELVEVVVGKAQGSIQKP